MRSRFTTLALLLVSVLPLSAQWQYVGAMHVARTEPTLTPLRTGYLLATGGLNDQGNAERSCELFDLSTWKWTMTSPMLSPRGRHVAVALPDGRVAVLGGYVGPIDRVQVTGSVEIYNPATETWTAAGSLQIPRMNFTATLLPDSTILVAGGYNGPQLNECEIYDPRTGSSRTVASITSRKMDHQAIALQDGRVLLVGGRIGGSGGIYLNEAEVFDPATKSWRVIDRMGEGRISGFTLDRFSDGAVLVAAGRNAPESSTTEAQILDPFTLTWKSVGPMRLPRVWHGGAVISESAYIATGGFVNASWHSNSAIELTATCELFDRRTGEWYMLPSLNTARSQHAMIHLRLERGLEDPSDIVLVAGGRIGDRRSTTATEVLDVSPRAIESYLRKQGVDCIPSFNQAMLRIGENATAAPTIHFRTATVELVRIELVTLDGRSLRTLTNGIQCAGEHSMPVDVAELPAGVYLVRMESRTFSGYDRLMIVR